MSSLIPVRSIGDQLREAITVHERVGRGELRRRVLEALSDVGFPAAERRLGAFPHELSGGLRQRVMIAMAMINRPALLIADEPTSALDVTTQSQILDLLARLTRGTGTAVILITHDLGVVDRICDDVVVMYAGGIVEEAPDVRSVRASGTSIRMGIDGLAAVAWYRRAAAPDSGQPAAPRAWTRGVRVRPEV